MIEAHNQLNLIIMEANPKIIAVTPRPLIIIYIHIYLKVSPNFSYISGIVLFMSSFNNLRETIISI